MGLRPPPTSSPTHPEGGYEVILLYVACLVALVVGGSGPFAVDGLIAKRLDARTRTSRIPTAAVR